MEHDHQQVYNIGIDDDSHVDNVSVFVNRQENKQQRFSPYQTQGREGWQQCPNFLVTSQRQSLLGQYSRPEERGEKAWIPIEIWKQFLLEAHQFLSLSTENQKTITNKHDSISSRKINKVDAYQ